MSKLLKLGGIVIVILLAYILININVDYSFFDSNDVNIKLVLGSNSTMESNSNSTSLEFTSLDDIIPRDNHAWTGNLIQKCMGIDITESAMKHDLETRYNHFMDIFDKTIDIREIINSTSIRYAATMWMEGFIPKAKNKETFDKTFGPFVPLFIDWSEMILLVQYTENEIYKKILCNTVLNLFTKYLSNEFIYVTTIQHDQGIKAIIDKCYKRQDIVELSEIKYRQKYETEWKNMILQIASGGYGHVVIPLLPPYVYEPFNRTQESLDILVKEIKHGGVPFANIRTPFKKRQEYLLGNSGRIWDIRYEFNVKMGEYIKTTHGNEHLYTQYRCNGDNCHKKWLAFIHECCKFMVTLRGRGPTTFKIVENLYFGDIVSVYIWDNPQWLPYKPFWDNYIVNIQWKRGINANKTIHNLVKKVRKIYYDNNGKQYKDILKWIKQNVNKYFTTQGILREIGYFLIDGPYDHKNSRSKLHCHGGQPLMRDYQV